MNLNIWKDFQICITVPLKTGVIAAACLRLDREMEVVIELLKRERRKSEKISALSLIIFLGISVS